MIYFLINTFVRVFFNISPRTIIVYLVDFIATLLMVVAIAPVIYIVNIFYKWNFSVNTISFVEGNVPYFMNVLFYNLLLVLNKKEFIKTSEYKEYYYLNIFQKKYYLIKYSLEQDNLMFITNKSKMLHKISFEGKKYIKFYLYYKKNLLIEYKKTLRQKFFSLDMLDFFLKFNILNKEKVFNKIEKYEISNKSYYVGFILWKLYKNNLNYYNIKTLLKISDYSLINNRNWLNPEDMKLAVKYRTWHNLLKNHKNYKDDANIILDNMRK